MKAERDSSNRSSDPENLSIPVCRWNLSKRDGAHESRSSGRHRYNHPDPGVVAAKEAISVKGFTC
jgi:hypothetical protein